ncbi:MAG: hypothetical protein N3E51_01920 [Candidatus Micrarchaeota archaeon]|nr:hypothetical protein [Candidatus Micrarchaeota archaeon]
MESQRVKSGIDGLDRMLSGGFIRNSVVAVAGGTGCGRTTFVSQFLVKGATDFGEPGLFLSFDEQKETLFSNLMQFGWDLHKLEREQKIVFIEYPQSELAEFADQESAIQDLIDSLGIRRVVIDSITPYALLFSNPEERRLNTLKLVSAVKKWRVTALISAEVAPGYESGFPHTVSGVESFSDGFIHILFASKGGRRRRMIEIIKMRGSSHEHELREANITSKGFSVGSVSEDAEKKRKRAEQDEQH